MSQKNLANFWRWDWLLLNTAVNICGWVRKCVIYWLLKMKHTVFWFAIKRLASSFIKNRVLSLDTTWFWPSLGLLMLLQKPLNCMALAQACEACCVLLISVRAVESCPDEVRKHSPCREEVRLPSPLPAPSSALYTFFWLPSSVYGLVSHIWALADHFLLPSLGSNGNSFL